MWSAQLETGLAHISLWSPSCPQTAWLKIKVFAAAPSVSAHHITIWLSIFGHHKNLPSADSKPLCYFFHTIPHNYVWSTVTPRTGTVIFCFLLFVICQYQCRKCKNPSSMMTEFFLYLHFAKYWSLAGISMCSSSWLTICPRLRIDVCLRKTNVQEQKAAAPPIIITDNKSIGKAATTSSISPFAE